MAEYTSTKEMVDTTFRVNDVSDRGFRMWDSDERKFLFADTPTKNYSPFWKIKTDKGLWFASGGQYSQLLIAAEKGGLADVLDKSFSCSSNGEQGTEVRYFFNLQKDAN